MAKAVWNGAVLAASEHTGEAQLHAVGGRRDPARHTSGRIQTREPLEPGSSPWSS